MLGRALDAVFQLVGLPGGFKPPKPLDPVAWDRSNVRTDQGFTIDALAHRFHELREEVPIDDFRKQITNPIASRGLAIWVDAYLPQLRRRMIFDTRVDNPHGLPPSLQALGEELQAATWPAPEKRHRATEFVPLGHSGSSCPGFFSRGAQMRVANSIEIPVEVLAFHAEGHNGEVAYGVTMYSEVTGRLSATGASGGTLTMWGKMLISIRPDDPAAFGGHGYIELVSRDYIQQQGTITGFPPKNPGEYIESVGSAVYVGHLSGQRHLSAVVERGRIIFSTDVDDFLQARTRITGFTLVDSDGRPIDPGPPPYSAALIGRIAGVRLTWDDVRTMDNRVTHYRLYRFDPDDFSRADLIADRLVANEYTDRRYDGRRSYTYAVVPAFIDQSGAEVQGVSLDYSEVMAIVPRPEQFVRPNFGVGHLRRPR